MCTLFDIDVELLEGLDLLYEILEHLFFLCSFCVFDVWLIASACL